MCGDAGDIDARDRWEIRYLVHQLHIYTYEIYRHAMEYNRLYSEEKKQA